MSQVIPEGWFVTSLDTIASWGSGGTPSRKNAAYYGGNVPWIKTGDLGDRVVSNASEFITDEAVKNSSAKWFPKGSVVLAMYGATIGKTSILGLDATTNQACGVGHPINGATFTEFLYYFLRNEKDAFIAKGKGGAQPNISQALIKDHEIALPPLAEQKVIADKLDELLAQVESTKARLDAIPAILKSFRQSVLAAAVSGKLTEEWRGNSELIGWQHGLLADFVMKPTYGSSAKSDNEGLVPVLRMGNLQDGKLDWSNLVYTSDKEEISKYRLNAGDVLFNRTNSPELVGKTSIFRGEREAIYAGYLIKITCLDCLNPEYLNFHLNSLGAKEYCRTVKSDGVSQSNINAKKLAAYPMMLPPVEEQTEIVRRVEELLAFADKVEAQVNAAQARVNNLTQSILAKAFRGELTADWRAANPELISGENSTEALLKRIKAERAKLKPVKKTTAKKAKA
ncbi:restriction endonuclease subunit S [Shewanella sp.]|uniref:restriction endonuclease subunit S n=1 Tax=Shewanella sp. TaxID=50422 RepID=UPI00262B06D3|nr:restriction endonuclease subunit S [Shewanella sp.]